MDSLSIAGATLAALLQSCVTQKRPCVGLLFGHVTNAVSSQAQDTSEDVLVTRSVGTITSSCTCVGTHTFYNNTGEVSEEQLAVLLSSSSDAAGAALSSSSSGGGGGACHQLLGWFSYRPHTPSIPSMLEAAVCRNLQAVLASSDNSSSSSSSSSRSQQQQQPLLFGLITSQLEHSGATVSLQHRFFAYRPDSSWQYGIEQYSRPSSTFASFGGGTNSSSSSSSRARMTHHPHLQPLPLQVLNLGQPDMQHAAAAAATAGSSTAAGGAGELGGARQGLQQLTALATALEASAAGRKVTQSIVTAAGQVSASGGQLSVIEGLYSSLLEELQSAAAAVGAQAVQLTALQETNSRLRQQLLAGRRCGGGGCGGRAAAAAAAAVVPAHDLL